MAFDFPTSPTAGQEFTPPGGPTYVWQSPRWIAKSGATAETYNRVVNPSMQVAQVASVVTVSGGYLADQWYANVGGFAFSAQKTSPSAHQIQIAVTTGKAAAAGEFISLAQTIEGIRIFDFGWGTASAVPVVLRFTAYSTIAGTFSAAITNLVGARSIVMPFTVAAGAWTPITMIIPGDIVGTTSTWPIDTNGSLILYFTYACGSTYTTAPGVWTAGNFIGATGMTNGGATTNNTFYIANVGLYRDPNNTGVAPPFVMPDEAQELAACQRYWGSYRIVNGGPYVTAGDNFHHSTLFPVRMRVLPAVAASSITASNCSGLSTYWVYEETLGTYATATASGRATYQAVFNCNARF
jgi:hypothetical protein